MPRKAKPKKKGKLFRPGKNDRVYTPDWLVTLIVQEFKPCGRILEPCAGTGAFVKRMPGCDSMELDKGQDFLSIRAETMHWDWIVTNPPWSLFREFLQQSMALADNIAFLSQANTWMTKARQDDMKAMGFGMVEMMLIPTPPKPWPQMGTSLAATWIRKGWTGSCHINREYMSIPYIKPLYKS